jgi:hypothetical protein
MANALPLAPQLEFNRLLEGSDMGHTPHVAQINFPYRRWYEDEPDV